MVSGSSSTVIGSNKWTTSGGYASDYIGAYRAIYTLNTKASTTNKININMSYYSGNARLQNVVMTVTYNDNSTVSTTLMSGDLYTWNYNNNVPLQNKIIKTVEFRVTCGVSNSTSTTMTINSLLIN